MRVRGVTLERKGGTKAYKGINGDYQRSQEVSSGRAVYVKVKMYLYSACAGKCKEYYIYADIYIHQRSQEASSGRAVHVKV